MGEPLALGVRGLAEALAAGTLSARELTALCLERTRRLDRGLNSFITVCAEEALAAADRIDAARGSGRQGQEGEGAPGPLAGIPIAHKDILCTEGIRTTCGSRMLADFVSPYDATAVARLRRAGLVTLGKTNMDEFAMGSSNETSWFGPVRNPWSRDRVPGGSSGGSAAAVAARLVPVATGSDTGGSIRQPAALCGVTGLKPTYGRVSRYGLVAFASSFDQAGLIAPAAEDIAWVLGAMAGFDPRDSTSVEHPVEDYRESLGESVAGLRIGIIREHFGPGLQPGVGARVEEAARVLEALGARLEDVSLRRSGLHVPTYYVLAPAECSSNLARYDGVRYGYRAPGVRTIEELYERTRSEGFGAEVKRRILVGTYALSAGYYDAYYRKAQQLRRLIADDYREAFSRVDLLLGPTTPEVAFPLGARSDDPVAMYLSDVYTIGVNLAGLCAISVPVGFADGLPVGMQLIGNHFREATLLRAAHRYQLETGWHRCTPNLSELELRGATPPEGPPAGEPTGRPG